VSFFSLIVLLTKLFNFCLSRFDKMASARSMLGLTPSTASTSDSVLVIVDAQNEYATGKLRVSNVETSRKVIQSLLQNYRTAKAPVVHVVHSTPEGAPVFTPNSELAEEFSELEPLDGEPVISKQCPGSFTGTKLQEELESTGRKKVVLVGYMV
jgi:nicotinamidase-related amidase